MANMTFGPGRLPPVLGSYGGMKPQKPEQYAKPAVTTTMPPRQGPLAPKPVVDPAQALQQQFATPVGRPATDFGGVQGGLVNDMAPSGVSVPAPQPVGGLTATRPMNPYGRRRGPGRL